MALVAAASLGSLPRVAEQRPAQEKGPWSEVIAPRPYPIITQATVSQVSSRGHSSTFGQQGQSPGPT